MLIAAETDRLKKAGKDVPADLADRVNPVGGLKELCDARVKNWPAIASEGEKLLTMGKTFPPDVRRVYDDARARVAARDAVKKALDARDARGAALAYQPRLIDDWADAALLTGARSAAGQVALLDTLKAAFAAPGDGRAPLKLWDESAPKLATVAEAKGYESAATGWRARIKAADDFLRAFAKQPQTEKELAEAWAAVLAAGPPHPSLTDAHRTRGEAARRWWPVLDTLRRLPAAATYDADSKLLAAWGTGAALAGCAEAAPFAPRADAARLRVGLVNALDQAIRRAEAGGSEDAVLAAAAKLPAGYPHPHAARVGEGAEAIHLLATVEKALAAPQPLSRAVAGAFDALKAKNPKLAARLDKTHPALVAKVEHALRRRELLDRFARIDVEESRADRQDRKWYTLWTERGKELAERDREELRARLTAARDRLERWGKVEAALKARDMFSLREQFALHSAALRDYPPLVKQQVEIQELLKKADRVLAVRAKVTAGSPLTGRRPRVPAPPPRRLRRGHQGGRGRTGGIAPGRRRQAGGRVPGVHRERAAQPRGQGVLGVGRARLIGHCVLAVDGRRFLADPDEAEPYSRAVCQPDTHQREGGGFTLVPPDGATEAYVTIWPVVELGWATLQGPPLKIGPAPVGAASATGSRS